MDARQPGTVGEPSRHRQQTEGRLVAGGFALLLLVGGGLLWILFGQTVAAVAIGVMIGAAVIFGLLWLLLRTLEVWATSE